ncbi:PREDICTED: supervillin-like isoform X2 [Dinoponera quadriceps]|uniref:Supervillin-like isoform X2 n=1 Tax=Dinoponera quadriceps TaxID=609295 RepID=A0A6P3WXZ0_DINQU|nr:PREDICTED: supervillin-like isoform X2 [Dinoponera quadriceps]
MGKLIPRGPRKDKFCCRILKTHVMVAAGATILMAASEENSSNETESGTTHPVNRGSCSQYGIQRCGQRNIETSAKADVATCSSNIKKKHCSLTTEKNGKIISKVEPKESSKLLAVHKTAQIRETRTSRLRAASIVLPSGATLASKRILGSEITGSQKFNSSVKEETSTSLNGGVTMNPVKERDKSYKRKSYLNRSRHTEAAPVDRLSETESSERRSRRQSVRRGQVTETASGPADSCGNRQVASPRKKHNDSKVAQCGTAKNLSKTCSSSSVVAAASSGKRSISHQPSISDSEVSRRVDALTALTRITMERVERLASATAAAASNSSEKTSPRKCAASRHTPVSILKHKTADGEGCERQASSGASPHAPSPVTFSPSVTESVSRKRHGILKKRSSLDESEILRRRSCSPDVSFVDSTYSEFRPILKNQRRSSLDEIVKRDQSPDQQPTSILKRKSSREDDREVHRSLLASPEPQSILKRKLANSVRANSVNHHVTIAPDVGSASACLLPDGAEGSEVRPILKKKHGREELAGNDVPSLEPRPILKKKSSTESDEHEHDRPKKTILKSSRKNSYEEAGEAESTSPRKLSALKNRPIENVRPILKQSAGSRHHDDAADLFLRKRAQSVGHARTGDYVESFRALAKRRSLESSSPSDVLRAPHRSVISNSSVVIKEPGKAKQTTDDMEEKSKADSRIHFDAALLTDEAVARRDEQQEEAPREDRHVRRSNSVSRMTQHFKALQEKIVAAESSPQRVTLQRPSHGVQRYRERKVLSGERFNTQPVTFEEVREAVLQNQRNAAALSATDASPCDEPSKLSLAERVRLFDRKISTADAERLPQRRRPATRYKTQPITSEEVEVASRVSPLNANYQSQTSVDEYSQECQRPLYAPLLAAASHPDVPKGILKSSAGQTHNLSRAKSPELRGMKLIKSVLKRECEESMEQQTTTTTLPSSAEAYPRSILKSNLHSRLQSADSVASRSEGDVRLVESQNPDAAAKSESSASIVRCALHRSCDDASPDDVVDDCKWRDDSSVDKIGRASYYDDEEEDDRASSSSGGHEIHNIIISEEKPRYTGNSLAKSVSQHAFEEEKRKQRVRGFPLPGLCRSATQVIASIETSETPSVSIADRLAALHHSGSTNWRRRVANVDESARDLLGSEESTAIKSGVLADCIGKLESAAEGWRRRIVAADAVNFTVAGKMGARPNDAGGSPLFTELATNVLNQKKRVPQRFKARKDKGCVNGAVSTPTSPCKDLPSAMRMSYSEPVSDDSGEECKTEHVMSPTVSVPKTDDETFTSFFSGVSLEKCETECLDLHETDFDIIAPQSELLAQKRNIRIQRRRVTSRNPLRALAARTDLRSEYTEFRTNIAARTIKSVNVEKLAKSSSFAVEALAGLASTEDFSAVTLRNVTETSVSTNKLQPFKDLMLILVKGRRHVQARLVEPVAECINSGDNYILVTRSEVFNYIGKYSNIIERTHAAEIASCILQKKDLGCQADQVITIHEDKPTCTRNQVQKFWSYLGVLDSEELNVVEAGHPDEDELYESAIIDTNMVYELKDKQLIPHEKFWGTLPKIEMLDQNKILVFDFGTEMYIWSGKGVSTDKKKLATQLVTEIWKDGYDYAECTICPINAARMLGGRRGDSPTAVKSAKSRPEWCLLAKLTQHVETILFREKFLDWPNSTNVIKARGRKDDVRQIDGAAIVQLDDNDEMWLPNDTPVDFVLEGCHLGRGIGCYDSELKKEYVVTTTSVMVWHIDEFSHTLLDGSSIGQFHSGDSYIVQWTYSVTITGRELSGLPSKHSAKGRDRSVYFIWQGRNASLNERGAAALLTVELDNDRGPQIRVVEGHEPAAFLNLFSGRMIVHSGKKSENRSEKRWRLYICRGTLKSETYLNEIPCSTRQLRSRGSFVLLDTKNAKAYIWHGNNTLRHIRENALSAANKLRENRPDETGLSSEVNVQICEVQESSEPEEFKNALGGINKKLYWSLETAEMQDHTPRLYHLSSILKTLRAVEILCPHRADLATPFPFSQDDLYQASQPALFLLDDKDVIWIWQGWWPDSGTEDQSGSKTVRWQAERRAVMTTAIRYWRNTRSARTTNLPIYLIWAGLEPLQFISLFPEWTYRDDVAELNIEDGRNPGEVLTVENELARLTQSTYPPAQLLQRPLPDGVDPTRLELYLSQQHFQELLGMSKEEFQQLPVWKQVNLKKEIGLF